MCVRGGPISSRNVVSKGGSSSSKDYLTNELITITDQGANRKMRSQWEINELHVWTALSGRLSVLKSQSLTVQ